MQPVTCYAFLYNISEKPGWQVINFSIAVLWIRETEVMEYETDLKVGKRAEGR